jgi:YidC/Oxa1 family membrane protein insertase
MDTQRLILLFIFGFSILLLWEEWQKEHRPAVPVVATPNTGVPKPSAKPVAPMPRKPEPGAAASVAAGPQAGQGEIVRVRTDLLSAQIDTAGATLSRVEFLKHKDAKDEKQGFVLLGPEHAYFAQSGLIGDGLPNHRTLWRAIPGPRELSPGADKLEVKFSAEGPDGVAVEKVYVFYRDRYVVDVAIDVRNRSSAPISPHAYFQLVRDGVAPAGQTAMMKTFNGAAVYTAEKAYQKVPFSDIDKEKVDYPKQATTGWIGMVEHYFVSAWLPPEDTPREYYTKKLPDGHYSAGLIVAMPEIAPGGEAQVDSPLFVGPQEQKRLKAAAPGLELVVDYGWLTIIAWPLFWLLQKFHSLSGNWGVAIILLTIVVKLVFFPLSAASYKSMAKMKLITPRLTKIREMYGNDRQKMNQAMMELYRTEKINPLGGCLPIVVQIPVFIALYWVLLAAIELRHAPFILWIKDLSALDPYYVLPALMTASMVLQTRMNPTPPDPVQAKVMTFMPFVFSVFFFFFPAGLVLYWLVNNILSILQQWQIQRMFERDKPAHAKR